MLEIDWRSQACLHKYVYLKPFFCPNRTGFIITASCDGHVKFWKKCEEAGIEFVKHFRSHLGKSLVGLCGCFGF